MHDYAEIVGLRGWDLAHAGKLFLYALSGLQQLLNEDSVLLEELSCLSSSQRGGSEMLGQCVVRCGCRAQSPFSEGV